MKNQVLAKLLKIAASFAESEKPIAYISGKVTGLEPKDVAVKFHEASLVAIQDGYQVFNPTEHIAPDEDWTEAMKLCLAVLPLCQTFYQIHDWKDSNGAVAEHIQAKLLALEIVQL
ncbi:DUF4406 domain-containing protein [Nubsella zeaxanthinifaciens]|uniref:DUF4406 domain-containing protein n=1 Tax=Nubsella zeaxanthinifaciens TaxID=392412 RepID=UPI000DE1FB59|nr:DUF4406 domain-containing protein [Nubsella zeaxanthinifaciens]